MVEIHKVEDSKGMKKLKNDAEFGGKIAGDARKSLEKRIENRLLRKKMISKVRNQRSVSRNSVTVRALVG